MAYKLYWDDGKVNSIDAIFTSNADSIKSFESNNQLSSDCQTTGGSNASITVFIEHQNFNNVAAGLYTDTVTFLLKAQ
jgi:spore coat protein U-like protein